MREFSDTSLAAHALVNSNMTRAFLRKARQGARGPLASTLVFSRLVVTLVALLIVYGGRSADGAPMPPSKGRADNEWVPDRLSPLSVAGVSPLSAPPAPPGHSPDDPVQPIPDDTTSPLDPPSTTPMPNPVVLCESPPCPPDGQLSLSPASGPNNNQQLGTQTVTISGVFFPSDCSKGCVFSTPCDTCEMEVCESAPNNSRHFFKTCVPLLAQC